MGQETELKFIGPEDAMSRLRDLPSLRRLAARRRATTRALTAVYFDTEDFALRDAGVVLRVRDEGQGFVQTVKSTDGPDIATRTEAKISIATPTPDVEAIDDKRIRRTIKKAVHGRALKPIFVVEVQRTTIVLVPKRGTEIEAAFDAGHIRTIDGAAAGLPILEFELELLRGDVNELISCAEELTLAQTLVLSVQSKSERGYALVREAANAPVGASKLVLPEGATAGDAFGRVVSHCLHHLLGNWESVAVARDPEGIHQMRVAIRRLRSAPALFGGPFRASLQPLAGDIQWLAKVLGAARDLDVFDDEVFGPAAEAHGADERFAALATIVQSRRQCAWDDVNAALDCERFRGLMLALAAVTLRKPWLETSTKEAARPALALASKRLRRRHAQAVKAGRKIEELDANARHKLRIRLKKLRYAVDFFTSLLPKREVKKYLRRLGVLQDVLGHMNDAAVARALVDDVLAGPHNDRMAIGYACGVVAGWHVGRGGAHRKALNAQWRRFAKTKPAWK